MGLTLKNRNATMTQPTGSVQVLGVTLPLYPAFLGGEWTEIVSGQLLGPNGEAAGDHVLALFSLFTLHRLPAGDGITIEELNATPIEPDELREISAAVKAVIEAAAQGMKRDGAVPPKAGRAPRNSTSA
jgi:hypothetical protein